MGLYFLHLRSRPSFLAAFHWARLCPPSPLLLLTIDDLWLHSLDSLPSCRSTSPPHAFSHTTHIALCDSPPLSCSCFPSTCSCSIHSIPGLRPAPCHLATFSHALPASPPPTSALFRMFFCAQLRYFVAMQHLAALTCRTVAIVATGHSC